MGVGDGFGLEWGDEEENEVGDRENKHTMRENFFILSFFNI